MDYLVMEFQEIFGIQPVYQRHKITDLMFLLKLVNNFLNYQVLFGNIEIIEPGNTISTTIFQDKVHPTSYSKNTGLSSLLKSGGGGASYLDFFIGPVSSFRVRV